MANHMVLDEAEWRRLPDFCERFPLKVTCKACGGVKFRFRLNDRVVFSAHVSDAWLEKYGEKHGMIYDEGDVKPDPECKIMGWNTSFAVRNPLGQNIKGVTDDDDTKN